jgi:hypothetical protein
MNFFSSIRYQVSGVLLLAACCLFPTAYMPPAPTCKEILLNTIASAEKIQSQKFHLKCNERIKGKLIATESFVKLNASPRKVYIWLKGPEVLWVEGQNNGNALVNPDGFPFMNLNLDPMGNIMRENQHHTIHEVGFNYFAGIIKNSIELSGNKFDSYFKCSGIIKWENSDCWLITAEYPFFKYEDYTVQKGETLVTIADKLKVSDYMLLEINSGKANHYNDIKAGQKIKIPNVYGSKLIIYIDKELLAPRVIKVYDEKGLFESYEYHDLKINLKIPDEEFTKDFKGYGF